MFRSLTESDPPPEADAPEAGLEFAAAGAELLELLELLQPAATSTAVAAAAAASPALADTEYNGVPRSFSQTCPSGHVRDQIPTLRPESAGLFAEIVGPRAETSR